MIATLCVEYDIYIYRMFGNDVGLCTVTLTIMSVDCVS